MAHSSISADSAHIKDGIIDFTAGSLGGIALVYVGQPLDTIKVKMQTFPTLYKGMVNCFKETLITDGIARGLYAGTLPALASNVTENSVLFMCYGFCQKFIQNVTHAKKVEDLSTFSNATAGFLAAFFSSVAICPTELVKCKLQAMYERNKQELALGKEVRRIGPGKLVKEILKHEGISGFFKGFTPTLVREMPGYFFFFGGYEGTRELLRSGNQAKEDIGLVKTMIAGAVGGMIFWTLTYPIDVAKSRIQVNSSNEYLGSLLISIARNEGVSALYNGLFPTLIRTIPATATLFVTYEYTKKFLHYACKDF
ncbi:hypothetical protein RN001_003593 [Aquatica leii]|uniref:Mitochondrial ornithine transporter 1 n=1 Tax=Aquatica leii TaxID=1421715 RepID=A0AAN7PIK3_9COLE|nr:hypothetical protein RN001_003593 [Aquatica leii]